MASLEGAMRELGVVPLPASSRSWRHCYDPTMAGCTCSVVSQAARSYRDHYVRVAWQAAFTTMHKVCCGHLDPVTNCSVTTVTVEEVQRLLWHTC